MGDYTSFCSDKFQKIRSISEWHKPAKFLNENEYSFFILFYFFYDRLKKLTLTFFNEKES